MLTNYSIKSLYPLALAEGEGVGTAYEYVAKRLVLGRWLQGRPRPGRILIAGLPQKYGASLDFFLLADEFKVTLTVIDEREEALTKAYAAVQAMQNTGQMAGLSPDFQHHSDLTALTDLEGKYDLIVSSEVLQRIPTDLRRNYLTELARRTHGLAVFAPNAANDSHTTLSGLAGIDLSDLQEMLRQIHPSPTTGYIDMPPFPPGITRDENQRQQATTGRLEAFAMWGLGIYVRLEGVIPAGIRRRQSHIVYGFVSGG